MSPAAMRFEVRALDERQTVRTVRVDAVDKEAALACVAAQRLSPLSARPLSGWSAAPRLDEALLAQQLQTLLGAGLSAIEALEALIARDEHDPARRHVLQELATRLRQGERLSQAMQALHTGGGWFSPLLVGLVRAAEQTSEVPRALGRYLAYRERVDGLRHRLGNALVYPAVLGAVGLVVCLFLLGYVVPRFATVVQDNPSLPWASARLMDLGQFVDRHAAWLLPGVALGTLCLMWQGWRAWHQGDGLQWLAHLPGAARHWQALGMARLYLTLGLLLDGGIPIQAALDLAEAVLPAARRPALALARERIAQGEAVSASLRHAGLATPVADRLIRVGEQTGQLGALLARAAAFHDDEASRWIERFSKAFEPMLMAAIGLVVGLIVVLLYLPIFDLAGSLGG